MRRLRVEIYNATMQRMHRAGGIARLHGRGTSRHAWGEGMMFQPVTKPKTWGEFFKVRPLMVDTFGNPLVSEYCARCRDEHFTVEPHIDEIVCPECGSIALRCHRPSGHDAANWHKRRFDELDRLGDEREAAGLPAVARWLPVSEAAPSLFELEATI